MSNHPLDATLIVGSGPAALQVAVLLKNAGVSQLGMVSRCSEKWQQFLDVYSRTHEIKITVVKPELSYLAGSTTLTCLYDSYKQVQNNWHNLVLSIPSDAYLSVLALLPLETLTCLKSIILLSPSFGSHLLVSQHLESRKVNCEVICLSNYFAATKYRISNETKVLNHAVTKACKKKLYLSSSQHGSEALLALQKLLLATGIESQQLFSGLSVEARNITSYVHPALFINKFSLDQIVAPGVIPKYMYKLYPEGPITPNVIKKMVGIWYEISAVVLTLNAEPINLLQFLNDDNYPVHELTISREQIDSFCDLTVIEQEYLLYIRYSAILIDPFSQPNEKGGYYDFSAVPYPKASFDSGRLILPRVPVEDIKSIYLFKALSKFFSLQCPTIDGLIDCFEGWYEEKIQNNDLIKQWAECAEQTASQIVSTNKKLVRGTLEEYKYE
ncbi:opine metallophore biosynthesis dehydrogenase [Spartinivicinus poritis]|uniref:Opine metallophore biosynthesis dehydrogenase n=1 Tax=Spartinivicinus poritis TaxID=2994640 RepID=A0ABT5UBE5_9GAMM|nr:opine metallophore biosynthesis dehydrogenase [Spartinivicinus sp. A2-2]MDE1463690.1 opine metallophore biosynthesis dehydrogenase [Spartinivicinus sp. A2-2]